MDNHPENIELKDFKDLKFSESLLSVFTYDNANPVSEEFERLSKLRDEDAEIDAIIRIDERTFHAHKIVLVKSSPTLKHFCASGECVEESPDVQTFKLSSKFLDPAIVGPLIDFLYTGKLNIANADIRSVCIAVHYLQLPKDLLIEIEKLLITQLTIQNALSLYKLSHRCELEALRKECLRNIFENHENVLKNEELLWFPAGNLRELINELETMKPEIDHSQLRECIFHFIIRWLEADNLSTKRSSSLPSLLRVLPLEKLSFRFLEEQIVDNTTFLTSSSNYCSRIFIDCLNKFSDPNHESGKNLKKTRSCKNRRVIYIQNVNQITKPQRLTEEPIVGNDSVQDRFLISLNKETTFIRKNPFSRYSFGVQVNSRTEYESSADSQPNIMKDNSRKEKLFCLGGLDVDEDGKELSSISCFNPIDGQWTVFGSSLKSPRYDFAATAINGLQIYIAGGCSNNDTKLNSFEMYDLQTEQWSDLPLIPNACSGCSMVFHKGSLYLAGGENDSNLPLTSVFRYSFETKTWTAVKPMNRQRSGLKLIELNGYIYAIGGGTNTVERYCPETDQWSMLVNMNYYQESFGATAHQGSLYVCGSNSFQMFTPDWNVTWRLLPSLNAGFGCELASVGGKLLAIGGCKSGRPEAKSSVFEYNVFTEEWIPHSAGLDTSRIFHNVLVF